MDYKMLGANIRKYRHIRGFRQEELAEMVGCTSSHIGQIENARGIPSLEMTVNIANALRVSVDQLLLESLNRPELVYLNDLEERLQRFPAPLKRIAGKSLDDLMHLLETILQREAANTVYRR